MRTILAFAWSTTLLLAVIPATAHFPPSPDTNCIPDSDPHDFTSAGAMTVTLGIAGERGRGVAALHDGALFSCGSAPLCPPGDVLLIIACSGLPDEIQNVQVPLGDGEFEFGFGGAFLPDSHHDPLTNGYRVDAERTEGGFVFGSDVNGDGAVHHDLIDCYESHDTSFGNETGAEFTTTCAAGADGGWWFFTKCNATAFPASTFTTNGPLLRVNLADDDNDSIPDGLEDDDADGLPDLVNGRWNPQVEAGDPNPSVNCLSSGHVGT